MRPLRVLLFLTAVAWLGAATPCLAGTIWIDFDLSGSSVSIPPDVDVPPGGTLLPGATLTLMLRGDVPADEMSGTVLPGAAVVEGLVVEVDVDAATLIDASMSGDVAVTQFGPAEGSLAGDLSTLSIDSIFLELIAFIDCSGSDCGVFGVFPVDIEIAQFLPAQTLTVSDANTPGGATISGLIDISFAAFQMSVDLQGTETSRAFVVPEPGTALLVLAGLAALRLHRR